MERLLVEADTRAAVSKTNGLQYIKHLSGSSFELVTVVKCKLLKTLHILHDACGQQDQASLCYPARYT